MQEAPSQASPSADKVREFLVRQIAQGSTPRSCGYYMPAEWVGHRATWLSWPHKRESWPGLFEGIPQLWAEFVRSLIAAGEKVNILAGESETFREAQRLVGNLPGCRLFAIPTDDAWIRDSGPTFLARHNPSLPPALVDWQYNAWGGKYPPYDLDNQIPARIAELLGYRRFEVPIVLEGGAIDTNGLGAALVARGCLLSSTRNPGLSERDLADFLREYLGFEHIIWVDGMLVGDDTDGHVDQLARFVAPRVVVVAREDDPSDENYSILREIYRMLTAATDQEGRPIEVVPLPMPRPVFIQGQRVPASYVNFYIANTAIIVPGFEDPADQLACDTLRRLFPDREIVKLPARQLVWGLGAFHCITQQEPAL
ncbi:MAG: agmatine deiminase family protein [Thermoguttaceae bacterium]|nr:agmatine deiminase family protein [Thermoguttaceae bacterium]